MSLSRSALKGIYKKYCQSPNNCPKIADGNYRVATFNIHYWTDLYDKSSIDGILSDIKQINADIICLQEVSFDVTQYNSYEYSDLIDLFKSCGYTYFMEVYGSNYLGSRYGNMILSKKQLTETMGNQLPLGRTKVKRGYCLAKVEDLDLYVCCVHLDVFDETGVTRDQQIKALFKEIKVPRNNLIICGDFNCIREGDYANDGKSLEKLINDDLARGVKTDLKTLANFSNIDYLTSFEMLSLPAPSSSVWSNRTVDFIFVPRDFKLDIINSQIYRTINSDHCAIYMDVKIKN